METSKYLEIKVGMFASLGILILILSLFLLGGDKIFFTNYYTLRTHFEVVQGLQPGSTVTLAGIPIGNVVAIEFAPEESKLEVTLKVDRDYQKRITQESLASIKTQGALGDKFVLITPGNDPSKFLRDDAIVDSTEGGDFLSTLSNSGDGVENIFRAVNELRILLSNLNAGGRSATFMKNLTDASGKLSSSLNHMNILLSDIRGSSPEQNKLKKSLNHLSSILEKIDKGRGTLGALINDPSIHHQIKRTLGGSPRKKYFKSMLRHTIQNSGK